MEFNLLRDATRNRTWRAVGIAVVAVACSMAVVGMDLAVAYTPRLERYIEARMDEFDEIPAARKLILDEFSSYLQKAERERDPTRLTFICTHNSRRSHMAQLWASVAARHFQFRNVRCFSGGTESTAFNPRAVASLQRAGFEILAKQPPMDNPRYLVRFSDEMPNQICYSKRFDDPANPQSDFCAVLVCSDADQQCPSVRGATERIALPFEDPKNADGTVRESAAYDERCRQIARELLYVFSKVGKPTHSGPLDRF